MSKKIRIGIIPAAGSGTRLGYLSHILPKTLFPLYDRPILHHVLEHMQSLGIEDVYVIVHIYEEKIIQYCKQIQGLNLRIHFIHQKTLSGTGAAIQLAEKYVNNEPFLVIYGDDFTVSESIPLLFERFYSTSSVVAEAVIKETNSKILQNTCSVKLDQKGKISSILEKPEQPPYKYRGCGIYLFRTEIFEYIKKTPIHNKKMEQEITHTIQLLAVEGKAYGHLINGYNININSYDDLLRASILFKKHRLDKNKF